MAVTLLELAKSLDPARIRALLEHFYEPIDYDLPFKKGPLAQGMQGCLPKFSFRKTDKRHAVKATNHFKVGDILTSSWGYSMTLVDFYEVIKVSDKSIVLRQIGSKPVSFSGYDTGHVVADPTVKKMERDDKAPVNPNGPQPQREIVFRRPVRMGYNGNVCVNDKNGHAMANKWDGQPQRFDHND